MSFVKALWQMLPLATQNIPGIQKLVSVGSSSTSTTPGEPGMQILAPDNVDIDDRSMAMTAAAVQSVSGRSSYCECDTISAYANKVADLPGFVLSEGKIVGVKFIYEVNTQNTTLNIANTGTYPIYLDGAVLTRTRIVSQMTAALQFHNNAWNLLNPAYDFFDKPIPTSSGGTGITVNPYIRVDLSKLAGDDVFKPYPVPGVSGVLGVANGGTGRTSLDGLFDGPKGPISAPNWYSWINVSNAGLPARAPDSAYPIGSWTNFDVRWSVNYSAMPAMPGDSSWKWWCFNLTLDPVQTSMSPLEVRLNRFSPGGQLFKNSAFPFTDVAVRENNVDIVRGTMWRIA